MTARRLDAPRDGWVDRLDGTLVEFYGADRRAWLRIGDVTRACTSAACVDWVRRPNGMARLSLVDGDEVVASVVYLGRDPSGIPPELDFTMTDSEDFDFGEFIRRRLDNAANLRRLFGDDLEYETDEVMSPRARAALDAMPFPDAAPDLPAVLGLDQTDLEREVARQLAAFLPLAPIGGDLPTHPYPNLFGTLEFLLPALLRRDHREWRWESLDALSMSSAVRTGEASASLLGVCTLLSDQTVTPFAVEFGITDEPAIDALHLRLGEPGRGQLGISGPGCNSGDASTLRMLLPERVDDVEWVYDVTW